MTATPNHAMPFRQAQGPELAEGQPTPNSESFRERLILVSLDAGRQTLFSP